MSLLPSRGPDVSTVQEGEMEVVGVDEDVEPLIDALSSDTARAVLNAIYDEPGTASEIADRLDMSIQKVSYHLDKLDDQDLIVVAGTRYSEKGQEMKIYRPPDEPVVLFVGTRERKDSLKTMVKRLLPMIGVLALASVVIEQFSRSGFLPGIGAPGSATGEQSGAAAGGDGGSGGSSGDGATGDGGDAGGGVGGDAGGGDGGDAGVEYDAADAPTESPTKGAADTAVERGDDGGAGGDGGISIQSEPTGTPQVEATQQAQPTPQATSTPQATPTPQAEPTGTPVPADLDAEAIDTVARATETAAGSAGPTISPGVAFFLGGLLVLVLLVGWWSYRSYA